MLRFASNRLRKSHDIYIRPSSTLKGGTSGVRIETTTTAEDDGDEKDKY